MADLEYKVDVDTGGAVGELNKLNDRIVNLQRTTQNVSSSLDVFKSTLLGIGAAVAGSSLFQLVDSLQNMENKIRISVKSQEEFNRSLQVVKQIADSTGQSMVAIGSLYAKVAVNAEKLGFNQAQVAATTQAFALALKVSGASAEGAASSIYQFSQILAKGTVNGDEFTTIMENLGGPVMDLVAKKLGVTTAELFKLKEEGRLTAKDFSSALIASLDELNQMSDKTGVTVGQALVKIQNAFANFLINFEKSTGFFSAVAKAMEFLANNADKVAMAIAAVAGAWAGAKIVAWYGLAVEAAMGIGKLIIAFRTLGITAAVAEALGTGGLSAIGAAAGATLAALAANAAFDKIQDSSKDTVVDLKKLTQEAQRATSVSQLDPVSAALRNFGAEARNVGDNFAKNNRYTIENIQLQTRLIGQSSLMKELESARLDLSRRQAEAIKDLELKRAKLTDTEAKERGGQRVKDIETQIARIRQLGEIDTKVLEASITMKYRDEVANKTRLDSIQRTFDVTKQINDLDFNTSTMGMTRLGQAIANVRKQSQDFTSSKIFSRSLELGISPEDFQKMFPREYAAILAQGTVKLEENTAAVQRNVNAQLKYENILSMLDRQRSVNEQLSDLYDEQAKVGLIGIEQKFYDIDAASRKFAMSEIARINKQRFSIEQLAQGYSIMNQSLGGDPAEVQRIFDTAIRGTEKLKQVSEQNYRAARTFSSGWSKAFKEYADNATNAAMTAQRIFGKTFQGIEDLIVDFVKTGKFNFKEFLADIGEEILRSQVRTALANIGQSLGVGGLFGGGGVQGGQGATATNPLFVSVVGGGGAFSNPAANFGGMVGANGIFGPGGAPMISGGGIGGGITGAMGGLGNIVSTVSNVWSGIKNIGGGLYDTVSKIGSGISDFFAGFFADGGVIPKGKFGVVGERGPEFVSGPATVTPMGGGGNVTYNINAVDAMSFKQMIARDPSFIHAVASQGARGTPGRY